MKRQVGELKNMVAAICRAAREAGALREAFLRLKTSAAGILGLQTD